MVRGVVVDRGEHKVVMRYRPKNLYLGAVLAAMGLLLCAALQFVPWEKGFAQSGKALARHSRNQTGFL
jgi:uncharacterized membrane protein YfhO